MKILGWILIIICILYAILPVHPYTGLVPTMSTNELGLPVFSTVEKTFYSWFLLRTLLGMLGGNFAASFGSLTGYFLVFAVGIWLIRKKRKSAAVNHIEEGK